MLRLYYVPGACSLYPHTILNESDPSFEIKMDRTAARPSVQAAMHADELAVTDHL